MVSEPTERFLGPRGSARAATRARNGPTCVVSTSETTAAATQHPHNISQGQGKGGAKRASPFGAPPRTLRPRETGCVHHVRVLARGAGNHVPTGGVSQRRKNQREPFRCLCVLQRTEAPLVFSRDGVR